LREQVVGVVRVAYTLTHIQQSIARIRRALLASVASYAFLIVVLTVWLAGTIVRPVENLRRSAERLASGDLDHRVPVAGTEEVVQLASTLNQMTGRLQQLEGMRRQYVSNVSHELRTPLAAIRGMAETIMLHGDNDPALRDRYLPRIITQTERLARLASQLLDLAQIESGDLVRDFNPVAIAPVLEEVVSTCAEGAAARGIELVMDVLPWIPPADRAGVPFSPQVEGDRDRLVQVFFNLVDNALRYTPKGGQVSVMARAENRHVTVAVTDSGPGIPPEHLPHIFERFYRVDRARSRAAGGTGLGLSIVQQIVKDHGGEITVDSAVGKGTRFSVTLPLSSDQALDAERWAVGAHPRRLTPNA
jgi:signal transduction histidine kinase